MGATRHRHQVEDQIRAAYARRVKVPPYRWDDPAHLFGMQERELAVVSRLAKTGLFPLERRRILEVGCGSGGWLRDLCRWGAEPEGVFGIELRPEPLATARRRCPPGVTIEQGSAADLPFPDESFDVVLQATMFSSILDDTLRQRAANEMQRVVRRGGAIVWYDFFVDNPRNRDVRGVRRDEIERLFAGCTIALARTGLAPPLRRALAPRSWLLAYLLSCVPALCTHYVGVIRRS